jgi:hypothetical protein
MDRNKYINTRTMNEQGNMTLPKHINSTVTNCNVEKWMKCQRIQNNDYSND